MQVNDVTSPIVAQANENARMNLANRQLQSQNYFQNIGVGQRNIADELVAQQQANTAQQQQAYANYLQGSLANQQAAEKAQNELAYANLFRGQQEWEAQHGLEEARFGLAQKAEEKGEEKNNLNQMFAEAKTSTPDKIRKKYQGKPGFPDDMVDLAAQEAEKTIYQNQNLVDTLKPYVQARNTYHDISQSIPNIFPGQDADTLAASSGTLPDVANYKKWSADFDYLSKTPSLAPLLSRYANASPEDKAKAIVLALKDSKGTSTLFESKYPYAIHMIAETPQGRAQVVHPSSVDQQGWAQENLPQTLGPKKAVFSDGERYVETIFAKDPNRAWSQWKANGGMGKVGWTNKLNPSPQDIKLIDMQ